MKAWLAPDVVGLGTGLGKKDVLVIPRENGNSLVIHVVCDGRIWTEERDGHPCADDPIDEIEISEELAREIVLSFENENGNIAQNTQNLLREFIRNLKYPHIKEAVR